MSVTIGGKAISDAGQLRRLLENDPDALNEVVPQLEPALRSQLELLDGSSFGVPDTLAMRKQVGLLVANANQIIADSQTANVQAMRAATLGYETTETAPRTSAFDAIPEADRTVRIDGPTGSFFWTLVSPEQAVYRSSRGAKPQGPVSLAGLDEARDYTKALVELRDQLVGGPELAKAQARLLRQGASPSAGPAKAEPGAKVERLRYGPTAVFSAAELNDAWQTLGDRGEAFKSFTVPAELSDELARALERANLIPPKLDRADLEAVMRGIWFGGGDRVKSFFAAVMSQPEQLAKVVANLRAYNQVAETSNFDPLFPNREARPAELLQRAAVVGFFARDNGLRRELTAAIEADLRDESAARVSNRAKAPPLDVAVIGSGPTGTAFASSLATRLDDSGTPANVAVFDGQLNGTFRLGASWRLNSPSRESDNRPGVPGTGDINYLSNIASVSDAEGGFWSSAEPVSQVAALDLFFSGVPVELDSTLAQLSRTKDGSSYELTFADGTKQIADTVVIGAGLGRGLKKFGDAKTDAFAQQEHDLNDAGGVDRAFEFLYADSLQLFEMTQKLNVPMQPFAPRKQMTVEALRSLAKSSRDPTFKAYLENAARLLPSQTLNDATLRPQQVIGLIGAGDGGKTVAELLTLLGPVAEANRTPAQLGIRPQILWFVGADGARDCTEFYVGRLEDSFSGVQKTFDSDPELKGLGINVFELLKQKSLEAGASAPSSDPQAYLTNSLQFFERFLGVIEPRKLVQELFPNLTDAQRTKVAAAFFKVRDAVRPRYNQLVQPIAKGQIKLVTDRVNGMAPTKTALGTQLTLKGANGEKYLVDRAIGTVGNENGTDEVIAPLLEGKQGKLPALKAPTLFEYIQVTDPEGSTQIVGKRLVSDPGVIFLGPGAIADFQKNTTAVGANTVSIFLNKPLNDLAAEDIAQGLKLAAKNRTDAEEKARADATAKFDAAVDVTAATQELLLRASDPVDSTVFRLPPQPDERLRDPVADRNPVALDVALGRFLGRVRGQPGDAFSLTFERAAGGQIKISSPKSLAQPLAQLVADPIVAAYLRALPQGSALAVSRTFEADGRLSLQRAPPVVSR